MSYSNASISIVLCTFKLIKTLFVWDFILFYFIWGGEGGWGEMLNKRGHVYLDASKQSRELKGPNREGGLF